MKSSKADNSGSLSCHYIYMSIYHTLAGLTAKAMRARQLYKSLLKPCTEGGPFYGTLVPFEAKEFLRIYIEAYFDSAQFRHRYSSPTFLPRRLSHTDL